MSEDNQKKVGDEETEGRIWRQVLIALAGSLGLAVVCCGGAFALNSTRISVLGYVGEGLATIGFIALGLFGLTLVGAMIGSVVQFVLHLTRR